MKSIFKSIVMGVFIGLGIFFMPFFIIPMMLFFFIGSMVMFAKMRRFAAYHRAAAYQYSIHPTDYPEQHSKKRQIEVL